MATVRGDLDLRTRPAQTAAERLRAELERTEQAAEATGRALDRIGTPAQQTQLRNYERRLTSLERTAIRAFGTVRREVDSTERTIVASVAIQDRALSSLENRLQSLSRIRATPEVDVSGITQALAQVELLHSRVQALGRERAFATVGVRRSAVSALGGAAGGGGGGPPGRSGGRGLRSIGFGPFNLGSRLGIGLIGAALPAAQAVGGAAVGVGGSLGAGALGAGAIGVAGGGVLAAAIGQIAAVAVPAAQSLGTASTALEAYNREVAQSGADSKEAGAALKEYRMTLAALPVPAREFMRERRQFGERWRNQTQPGQRAFFGIGQIGLEAASQLTPLVAGKANQFMQQGEQIAPRLGRFINNRDQRRGISALGDEATRSLDETEAIIEHLLGTFLNLSRAARPFFRESLDWIRQWTHGWETGTDDIQGTRREIGDLVDQMKTWLRLGGATFDLLKDLMSAGAPQGQSLVELLTKQLREWDRWVKDNPRQVRVFFRDTTQSTIELARALGRIAHTINELATTLRPILDQFSRFISLLGDVGLLSPGGLPLLLSLGAGLRGGITSARGRIAGTAPTAAAPGILPVGTGAPRGAAASRTLPTAGTPFTSGAARGSTLAGVGGVAARAALGRFLPTAAVLGGLQAASFPGNASERLQAGLSSVTVGAIPMPKTGDEIQQLSTEFVNRSIGNVTSDSPLGQQRDTLQRLRSAREATLAPSGQFNDPEQQEAVIRLFDQAIRRFSKSVTEFAEGRQQKRQASKFEDLTKAADIRLGELGPGQEGTLKSWQALAPTFNQLTEKIQKLHGDSQREFAQMTLDWVKEMKRAHPEMAHQFDLLRQSAVGSLEQTSKKWKVIGGQIRDVSAANWENIRKKMSSESAQAAAEASENLTLLQRKAIAILQNMGFSATQSRHLIAAQEAGGQQGQVAQQDIAQGPTGAGQLPSTSAQNQADSISPGGAHGGEGHGAGGGNHARGGRLVGSHGRNFQDHVELGGGDVGAGGELMMNRHTEQRVDRMLRFFGTSAGREVNEEQRPHSGPLYGARGPAKHPWGYHARGGRRYFRTGGHHGGGGGGGGGGGTVQGGGSILSVGQWGQQMGLSVSEGPGFGGIPSSGHATNSLHYSGLAYDLSGPAGLMMRFRKAAESRYLGHGLNELFYDPYQYYIDEGHKVQGAIGDHSDHVHIGFFPGGPAGATTGGGGGGAVSGGGAPQQIPPLHAQSSRFGGLMGAMSNAAGQGMAAGMTAMINKRLRRQGGGGGGGGAAGDFSGAGSLSMQQIEQLAGGVGMKNPHLMAAIAMAESGGDVDVINSIGATGLWQVLQSAHPQYSVKQLTSARGNAMAAKEILGSQGLGAWEAYTNGAYQQYMARGGRLASFGWGGWRAKGFHGRVNGATLFGAGESGPEDVSITPHTKTAGRSGGDGSGGVQVHFNDKIIIREEADIDRLSEKVGEKALKALQEVGVG